MGQKETLIISVTIFLTVLTWILGDLFHVANTEKVKVKDRRFLSPIRITLDRDVLKQLQDRQ
ncbi:hypothetical protein A2690_03065 [Candidatus Roizmanbacteria bacterium RIFCSPHIGHO2_01_FULL_39_12b]|uniref:Uncharacterized protein n=1 Tax=Candidatus Roizmanbacteria bacterium RIFCSPHIGHO2_01_FULL_39_12b TaxID=1802030 RepID=A0A1F7G988_9BACT|nr:MAG: hypothetical protein A2690_03065 [Candidatus Roizmanbacteria bacterium RIFCSPHIGHO2_01_FULL_39_12b]OGK45961.1 MAG: hypothetical protein A3B46_00175 [Candidatus Roizmanbacteria bacterium RIFCSPLOWO2_01_FULL_39_19]